jgi:hypothetical protein
MDSGKAPDEGKEGRSWEGTVDSANLVEVVVVRERICRREEGLGKDEVVRGRKGSVNEL